VLVWQDAVEYSDERRTGVRGIWSRVLDLPGHFLDVRHRIREKEILLIRQILFSGVVGILTGALVAVFDYLLEDQAISFLYNVRSTWSYFLLPVLGLGLAAAATRYLVPSREGKLTEDYILVYHAKERRMRLANLPGKMLASFVTIAMGGSMGLEGPSIYMGSALGDAIQKRFDRLFTKEDGKLLLVAGASAGAIVGALGALTYMQFGEPYIYGPGYHLIRHTLSFQDPLLMLAFLFGAKAVATAFSAAGGGVGGLFFPMTVMGVVVGSGFTHLVSGSWGTLYPLIGLAAFVAAGYRTPLAAVSFVAETTGNPWVLIPAMLASVTSFLTMGDRSISHHQRSRTPEF